MTQATLRPCPAASTPPRALSARCVTGLSSAARSP